MSARLPGASDAAVGEAVGAPPCATGLQVHGLLEREALAPGAVAHPVGEQVASACSTSQMRPQWAPPSDSPSTVPGGSSSRGSPRGRGRRSWPAGRTGTPCRRARAASRARPPAGVRPSRSATRRDARRRRRLVVGRVAEREDLVPPLHEAAAIGLLGGGLLGQQRGRAPRGRAARATRSAQRQVGEAR